MDKREKHRILRISRITAAAAVFTLFTLAFFGIEALAYAVAPIRYLQFVPSVINAVTAAGGVLSLGFVIVIVLTFFTGRTYCSFLCPLGILQDIIIYISGKPRRKPHLKQRPRWTGFVVLAAAVIAALAGTLLVINLVGPYIIYGKIITNLVKPPALLLVNGVSLFLEQFNVYWVTPVQYHTVGVAVLLISAGSFLLVFFMAFFRGRLFCNSVCPVGSLLSLVARRSLFRVVLDADGCISCGRCETVCKAGCIDGEEKTIDTSRCIACFDCLQICPQGVLTYRRTISGKRRYATDDGRRRFLTSSAALAGSITIGALLSKAGPPVSLRENHPSFPPGGESLRHFTTRCVACGQCISVCPTRVLRYGLLEYGVTGIMLPRLDYWVGFCEYECNRCTQVCPSGALAKLPLAEKKRTQLGTVKLVDEDCVVFEKGEDCGACAEVCPTHAVYTEQREDGLFYPVVQNDPCIGCGSCEHACPTDPKAIFVRPNTIHKKAAEPRSVESLPGRQQPEGEQQQQAAPQQSEQRAGEKEFPF